MTSRGRGGGGEHGCTEHGHVPATDRRGRDEDASPHSAPPFPFPEVALEMKKKQKLVQQPSPEIPDNALVEILSRVPYRSLCRFKCVSKSWLALCSDPGIRRRCPQTLTGFFYNRSGCGLSFRNLSGKGAPLVDPSLPFLRGRYERVEIQQCCGGLLLCRCWDLYKGRNKKKFGYAVCNPATGEWTVLTLIVLPDPVDGVPMIYDVNDLFLGFDAAVPSRFVVFAPLSNSFGEFAQVAIFSSETRRWTSVESEWPYKTVLLGGTACAYLNGTMHLTTHHGTIVTVDAEGKTWREIEDVMEDNREVVSIGHSQGSLHAWLIDNDKDPELCVWVLEDHASGKWTLNHTVEISELFGRQPDKDEACYSMLAIHPDCNLVFLTDNKKMTVSYDMDTRKVDVICTSGELLVGAPYVPCFVEMSAGGH
ncbi:hypothetical protein CFC21_093067 [Triticum aestivum]|uniref:F-box domain-containing protein n=3 Tax=Triticinae TaxID=1648030 RepID=A0A453P7W6_AEGTS|nr:F-box protein At5g07610-like [Aegilops tauschii subsp. strangulata]XP_044416635.1 F-box protein At5g07610-like [Triticum aestivum]KAF7090300.1 hypothetical protein CFC21_093067 [Triticum aestivum]